MGLHEETHRAMVLESISETGKPREEEATADMFEAGAKAYTR
jgi:hypothetical protein